MPTGFNRFRYLNESAKKVTDVKYTAHSDAYGETTSTIISQDESNDIATGSFHSFPVPGGSQGIPGVASVMVNHVKVSGAPDITEWLLSPGFEGYLIREVELVVQGSPNPVRVTARIFLTDSYYEEHVRFF